MEIGGGSVRIHDARLQEWVLREVLKVRNFACLIALSTRIQLNLRALPSSLRTTRSAGSLIS